MMAVGQRNRTVKFPAYTYVPSVTPHPISHPDGHMFGVNDPHGGWPAKQVLTWGAQLFDAGFYWESHEAWEHLWLGKGRTTPEALTVKGLIKLAAAGVKCLEQNVTGAKRHATRAHTLLRPDCCVDLFSPVSLTNARRTALTVSGSPPLLSDKSNGAPIVIPGFLPLVS